MVVFVVTILLSVMMMEPLKWDNHQEQSQSEKKYEEFKHDYSKRRTRSEEEPTANSLQYELIAKKGHEADPEYSVSALTVLQIKITNATTRTIKECEVTCIIYDEDENATGFDSRCIVWNDEQPIPSGESKYKEFAFFDTSPASVHSVGFQIKSISF